MAGRKCLHCKQWVDAGEAHDCWTTTESALTSELPDDLREAWQRFRETAVEFGDQRIYASHNSIMFSRRACYVFVRPKRQYLEVCIFLGRALRDTRIRKVIPTSKTKYAHILRIVHRDEVESPIADWMAEAYEFAGLAPARGTGAAPAGGSKKAAPTTRAATERRRASPGTQTRTKRARSR